jgi:O-antigen/teichoic acid export membrane protein
VAGLIAPDARLVVRGVVANYLHLGVGFLALVILTPVALQTLGAAAYGLWAVFNSLLGYFVLLDFGMSTATAKYTAEYRATARTPALSRLVSTVLAAVLVAGGVVVAVFATLAPLVGRALGLPGALASEARLAFILLGVNVAVVLVGGVFGNVIYGHQRVDVWKLYAALQIAANAALSLVFLGLGFGLVGLMAAGLIANVALVGLYLAFLRRSGYGVVVDPRLADRAVFREIGPYSGRTFVLGLTNRLLHYSDFLVIALFLGTAAVAPYEVGYKVCFLTTYVFSVISSTLFPRFAALDARGEVAALRELYLRVVKGSLLVLVPIEIFLLVFGRTLLRVWVGPANALALDVFLVLVAMNVFHALGTPAAMLLQSIGRNRELMYSEIANAVLNVGLSVVLVQRIGLLGVAVGTVVAHLLTSFWVVVVLPARCTRLPLRRYFASAVLPPLLVGVPVLALAVSWVAHVGPPDGVARLALDGVLVALVYAATYWAVGASGEERRLCRRLLPVRAWR